MAELLIALGILGVIATFTIPKIISAQQNGKNNAIAKEDIATMEGALQQALLAGAVNSNTKPSDLTPYLNYVNIDTTGSTIDGLYNFAVSNTCQVSAPCIRMHNGSAMWFYDPAHFGGTTASNAILFQIDPDGQLTSSTNNSPNDKTVEIYMYYSGRVSSRGQLPIPAVSSDMTRSAVPSYEPPWFSW